MGPNDQDGFLGVCRVRITPVGALMISIPWVDLTGVCFVRGLPQEGPMLVASRLNQKRVPAKNCLRMGFVSILKMGGFI